MLPYSLDILSDSLAEVHVPTGPFDPNGEWEHNYLMWSAVRPRRGRSDGKGSLRIRRRPNPDGSIRLQLTQITNMSAGSGSTTGVVTCANDELATPIRWKIDSAINDPKGRQIAYTAVSVSGEAANGRIVLHGEKDISVKTSGRLSSNWSLFDALQRLPFDSNALTFDMLEELELLKPEQRLTPGPSAEVELGGRKVKLHSFEHFGRGILPFTYWLDDEHRLLVVIGGRRAFLLDSASGGKRGAK